MVEMDTEAVGEEEGEPEGEEGDRGGDDEATEGFVEDDARDLLRRGDGGAEAPPLHWG